MQYIYKFYNQNNECLYIGKTYHLKPRFIQHKKDKAWWNEVVKIEYGECIKDILVDIYEIYYIDKLKPKYNIKDIKIKFMKCHYPELTFINYDINELKNKNKRRT
jgi:excinuclease UvrABC nuclease subunit